MERELRRTAIPADRPYVGDTRTERSGRWLWPAVGVTAAILLWIAVSVSRPHRVAEKMSPSASAMDTMLSRAGGVIDTSGGEVSPTISGLGALGKRRLPNGIVIDVPAYGMEPRVIAFIEGSQPAGTHNSFDLDRLTFVHGSAQLLPESHEQLNTIASILSAYPNVTVKIAGYGEGVGSPVTDLKLSQQRANAVKHALVASGVASNRMTTEAGSVRNRRVSLEIVHP